MHLLLPLTHGPTLQVFGHFYPSSLKQGLLASESREAANSFCLCIPGLEVDRLQKPQTGKRILPGQIQQFF